MESMEEDKPNMAKQYWVDNAVSEEGGYRPQFRPS